MDGNSFNIKQEQIGKLKELFPEMVSEKKIYQFITITFLLFKDAGVDFMTV